MQTHCKQSIGRATSSARRGATVVAPTRTSWRAVLYFEMAVGFTSADGMEKSQYRVKVRWRWGRG